MPDSLIEDRRVGGQSRHGKLADITAQCAARQQLARDVVEPKALTEIMQLLCGFHIIPYYVQLALVVPRKTGRVANAAPAWLLGFSPLVATPHAACRVVD